LSKDGCIKTGKKAQVTEILSGKVKENKGRISKGRELLPNLKFTRAHRSKPESSDVASSEEREGGAAERRALKNRPLTATR